MSDKDNTRPQLEKADVSSNDEDEIARPQKTMTKAIWLACIALCLSYTTAFQQNSCTAAIVKHIDAELGRSWFLEFGHDLTLLQDQQTTTTGFSARTQSQCPLRSPSLVDCQTSSDESRSFWLARSFR
jgi:hypothetical protein